MSSDWPTILCTTDISFAQVILLVLSGELLNNIPVVWRLYSYIPVIRLFKLFSIAIFFAVMIIIFISWVTRERSDQELYEMAQCDPDSGEGRKGENKAK